ncbi:MAG TPA: hypothetical protein P5305_04080 [Rubrivivax sp.]|nr:hypothetical protein [Rubrivivax sp.]HRY87041.1 hypothetical protein [Rubrivivax sp.]
MQDTDYEDAWNEEEDVPLVDAVKKARDAAEGAKDGEDAEDEYVKAHRELDEPAEEDEEGDAA